MRGEKKSLTQREDVKEGSPPHARGKGNAVFFDKPISRITPACAGKSRQWIIINRTVKDHPRMRGEKTTCPGPYLQSKGSPPHARGKVFVLKGRRHGGRITPACAGKSLHNYEQQIHP